MHQNEHKYHIPIEIIQLIENIKSGLETTFRGIEAEDLLSEATILGPRFKKKGFKFPYNYELALRRLKKKILPGEYKQGQVPVPTAKDSI